MVTRTGRSDLARHTLLINGNDMTQHVGRNYLEIAEYPRRSTLHILCTQWLVDWLDAREKNGLTIEWWPFGRADQPSQEYPRITGAIIRNGVTIVEQGPTTQLTHMALSFGSRPTLDQIRASDESE